MTFAARLGLTITPILLMLSPLAVMATDHCGGWHLMTDGPDLAQQPCVRYHPPLM